MMKILTYLKVISVFIVIQSCISTKPAVPTSVSTQEPKAEREFRAAWVATVANINWPSKRDLSTEQQQKEAIELLDFLKSHNFNAVIFQVRPQADALYKSDLEPWSYYLTGAQGKAPEPYYDPLEFWINAAHERGIELHVWLNPYRAHHVAGGEVSDHSIVKKRPELVVHLKEGYWWFDPSLKATQDHSTNVVMDIVRRYDIDGVHFDDYFYPYPSYNNNEDFPDSVSWSAYKAGGGKLSKSDWRRESVNSFISRLYLQIKAEKKHVKFGLSPFGIWKPGHPESIAGFDQHEVLYADAKLWLNKGWIDYFSPQLYWPINRIQQSFPVLLGWWNSENIMKRHLWPGISVGNDTSARNVNEIMSQVMITRGMLPQSKGIIHWSIFQVFKNKNMADALLNGPYKNGALVPATPWLDATPPLAPQTQINTVTDSLNISWTHPVRSDVFRWVVYYQHGNLWNYKILERNASTFMLPLAITLNNQNQTLNRVAVAAVDRMGNESARTMLNVKP